MSDSVGNIMSRLQGLKNVSGRRVMQGADFLKKLEDVEPDVSRAASPPINSNSVSNLPESDSGGELTSQSYDVRANSSQPVEEQPEESFFTKFGRALAFQTGNVPKQTEQAPIETRQVEASEGLPTNQPPPEAEQSPEFSNSTIWNKIGQSLKDYVKTFGTENHSYGKPTAENAKLMEDAQLRTQGLDPETYRQEQATLNSNTQQAIGQKIDKAMENPYTTSVYGSTDIVANQPELQAKFQEVTGMNFDEQIASQTKEYEKILDDLENNINETDASYTEQEKRIKDRILANQANDMDKFYVGLALLMPLLAGAFFGKEAALGALSGGAQGISNVYSNRMKQDMDNEELLAGIGAKRGEQNLKRGELDLKRMSIPSEIRKNLPKDERDYLIGKQEVTWTDPNTGEEKRGIQIKPNLVARPEFVSNKEELKEMRKQATDISDAIIPTKDINKLTEEIIDISSKMKDKNIIGQALGNYLEGKGKGLPSKLAEPIEYNGRMVNSYVVLEHKIKLLVDAYRQAKGMRALTESVKDHIEGLFRNPSTSFQSYQDTIDQMLYTRDLAQNRLINTVSSAGFAPEFVIKDLQPDARKTFNNLNYREGEKESDELLR